MNSLPLAVFSNNRQAPKREEFMDIRVQVVISIEYLSYELTIQMILETVRVL